MIIFDTETNGLIENLAIPLKRQPQIIELFALKLDNERLAELQRHGQGWSVAEAQAFMGLEDCPTWASLFAAKVSEEITQITSITPEMLQGAPKFAERLDELAAFFLGEVGMAGHNLAYDRDMLWLELKRLEAVYKFPWPQRHICTVEATEDVEGYRLALAVLHEQLFGEAFDGAHRAESDVRATSRCVVELVRQGRIKL